MKGYEVIHIKLDWLLVFKTDKEYLTLVMFGKTYIGLLEV